MGPWSHFCRAHQRSELSSLNSCHPMGTHVSVSHSSQRFLGNGQKLLLNLFRLWGLLRGLSSTEPISLSFRPVCKHTRMWWVHVCDAICWTQPGTSFTTHQDNLDTFLFAHIHRLYFNLQQQQQQKHNFPCFQTNETPCTIGYIYTTQWRCGEEKTFLTSLPTDQPTPLSFLLQWFPAFFGLWTFWCVSLWSEHEHKSPWNHSGPFS